MRPWTPLPASLGLLLLVLLAGCASHSSPGFELEAEEGARYFVGLESEYCRRLSSLRTEDGLPPSSVMHDALIAGDGDIYVTATLYRADAHVAMDMIVLNHSEEPVGLARDQIRLVDSSGRFFEGVDDFGGAAQYGLRSRRVRQPSAPIYSGPVDVRMPEAYQRMSALEAREQKGAPPQGTMSVPQSTHLRELQPMPAAEPRIPNAPAMIHVAPRQGRAYWVYWAPPEDPVFPLTAFVMLGDRHVQFQFDPPLPQ